VVGTLHVVTSDLDTISSERSDRPKESMRNRAQGRPSEPGVLSVDQACLRSVNVADGVRTDDY